MHARALYFVGIIAILIDAAPPTPKPINSPPALKLTVNSTLSILYWPIIRVDISSHIPIISSFALSNPLFKAAVETVFRCSWVNGLLSLGTKPCSFLGRSKEGANFPSLCPHKSPRLRSTFSGRSLVLPDGMKCSDDLSLRPRKSSLLRSTFSGTLLGGLFDGSKNLDLVSYLFFSDRLDMEIVSFINDRFAR